MAEEKDTLLTKLEQLQRRYSEIEKQMAKPEIARAPARLTLLSKEQGKLKPIVAKYGEYEKTMADIKDAEEIVKDGGTEQELKALAEEELVQLENKRAELLEEIRNSLITADEADVSSVIMEIRAGTGGDEAALFARDLYNMYVKYAENRKWKVEALSLRATETGGFREAIFGIKGGGVWSELGYEAGGHRVQRVPETESQGRIHTSAATVAVLPEPEEIDIKINPDEVLEHVSRASGPGGQSVNKLNSAIKLEHTPTGITVSMRDEKSQHKNRAKAWRVLRSRIYEHHRQKERAERDLQRRTMIGSGDRSGKIRTYNFPQNRLTDHRIKLTLYSLDKIMAGDMGEVIAALNNYDREQRLKDL